MSKADSVRHEANAGGTKSSTPGHTAWGSRLCGLIRLSWSNPLRKPPCGLKTTKYPFPEPSRIDPSRSFFELSHALLKEKSCTPTRGRGSRPEPQGFGIASRLFANQGVNVDFSLIWAFRHYAGNFRSSAGYPCRSSNGSTLKEQLSAFTSVALSASRRRFMREDILSGLVCSLTVMRLVLVALQPNVKRPEYGVVWLSSGCCAHVE